MKDKTDKELVNLVVNYSSSEALKILTGRHGGIYNKVSKSMFKAPESSSYIEMMNDMDLNFFNFCKGWKPELSQFVTHVGNSTRYICLNKINKQIKRNNRETLIDDEKLNLDNYYLKVSETEKTFKYLSDQVPHIVSEIEDERARDIITRRFLNDRKETLESIGASYNITGQAVLNIQQHAIKQIKSKLQKLI